jgi:branched-chain amino acid transport system ATP-binding protein
VNAQPERPGQPRDPAQPGHGDGGPPAESVLNLDRLSLSFGGLRALSELDLRVDDGEIVSLIGPNGAGKTTVFNVITGVYRPSSGTSISPGGRSRGSRRIASPGWGSRAPSRPSGCS